MQISVLNHRSSVECIGWCRYLCWMCRVMQSCFWATWTQLSSSAMQWDSSSVASLETGSWRMFISMMTSWCCQIRWLVPSSWGSSAPLSLDSLPQSQPALSAGWGHDAVLCDGVHVWVTGSLAEDLQSLLLRNLLGTEWSVQRLLLAIHSLYTTE